MASRYPLEPVAKARQVVRQRAGAAFADACRAEERALAEQREREEERRRHEEQVRGVRDHERERLERGELAVADLVRAAAFEAGATAEQQKLRLRAAEAERKAHQARALVEEGRAALARADRDAEAVGRHHERWRAGLARDALAAEELESEEIHTAAQRAREARTGGGKGPDR